MKQFIIAENDAAQRLDRFASKVTTLPPSLLQKYIRLKRIKCNHKRAYPNTVLKLGDVVEMYINDSFFPEPQSSVFPAVSAPLQVVYQDADILIVDKPKGLKSQPDHVGEDCLITRVIQYLIKKHKYFPAQEASFQPALCNRLDRNTAGLVIAAKNATALRMINEKLRHREIQKYYIAVVAGRMPSAHGMLRGYHTKDEKAKKATITEKPRPACKEVITEYRVLQQNEKTSLLELQLHTGRFHQIRAQLAAAGHPLVGDSKYGGPKGNFSLTAYRLVFAFQTGAGALEHLNGKEWKANR